MKKITALTLSMLCIFLMVRCQSTSKIVATNSMNSDFVKEIPHLANRIYVTKQGISPDNMLEELRNILLSRGHVIVIYDKSKHYIVTDTKDVGNSTLQRMTFAIKQNNGDSQLKITTEWKSGSKAKGFVFPVSGYCLQQDWAPARWEKNRLGIAFAESAVIAHQFKDGLVTFDIQSSDLPWYDRKRNAPKELAAK